MRNSDELTFELFHGGAWHRAFSAGRVGEGSNRTDPTWLEYEIDYATAHLLARAAVRSGTMRSEVDVVHEAAGFHETIGPRVSAEPTNAVSAGS